MQAAQADMGKAKACLAMLFMHAACSLPADTAGQDTLRALATPLAWREQCEYESQETAMELLFAVRHAHGPSTLMVFDADHIVLLYLSIHDPLQVRAEPSDSTGAGGSSSFMVPRRSTWRQGTL
jgi:hypothetical protein